MRNQWSFVKCFINKLYTNKEIIFREREKQKETILNNFIAIDLRTYLGRVYKATGKKRI